MDVKTIKKIHWDFGESFGCALDRFIAMPCHKLEHKKPDLCEELNCIFNVDIVLEGDEWIKGDGYAQYEFNLCYILRAIHEAMRPEK